ncbi:hypothetical protein WKW77_16560 [Variovorax ureilyticus]|uniref:Uncharacterized protein n=1 Tax=Variovorax ureilyticus TaxID=1836198 RepID=A0ABU8VG98_9BURK
MYYMDARNISKPQWTSAGLLGLLRASLPPTDRARAVASHANPPPERLDSDQIAEVASAWRDRSSFGDLGAESVAQALEMVARRRAEKQNRIQAMGKRLTDLMRLP